MTTAKSPVAHNAEKFVPVQTRSERPKSFVPADFSAPTNRDAEWKYSPVDKFAPLFVDEAAQAQLSYDVDAPEGVEVASIAANEAPRGRAFIPENIASATAHARTEQGLLVRIPAEQEIAEPVRVRISGDDATKRSLGHIVLHAERHARGTVILEYTGSALHSENVEIVLDDESSLKVIALHEWNDDTVHLGIHHATVGRAAAIDHSIVTFGGAAVRVNPEVHLDGNGAESDVRGLYYADAGQHFEHQVYIDHAAERTRTDVNYKGALQGSGARTVWIGDVLIREGAVGTDSYEQNRNLVLSDGARADSVPNLEIECGDIEGAGHASATGRFDEEHLFYLMARGIDELSARRLVVHGFLNEIVQQLDDEALAERVQNRLEEELKVADAAIAAIYERERAEKERK